MTRKRQLNRGYAVSANEKVGSNMMADFGYIGHLYAILYSLDYRLNYVTRC